MKPVETYKCDDCKNEWSEPYAMFMPPVCSNCGEYLNVLETTDKSDESKLKITFKLFEVSNQFNLGLAESELKLSYETRFKCNIVCEKYGKQKDFIIIEVDIKGLSEAILEATAESEHIFKKYAKKVVIHSNQCQTVCIK